MFDFYSIDLRKTSPPFLDLDKFHQPTPVINPPTIGIKRVSRKLSKQVKFNIALKRTICRYKNVECIVNTNEIGRSLQKISEPLENS